MVFQRPLSNVASVDVDVEELVVSVLDSAVLVSVQDVSLALDSSDVDVVVKVVSVLELDSIDVEEAVNSVVFPPTSTNTVVGRTTVSVTVVGT